jgi:hypothetical protein
MKIRGMQLFERLKVELGNSEWFTENDYEIEMDQATKSIITFTQNVDHQEMKSIESDAQYAVLPVIMEIKVVSLEMGAIVQDVLQENHKTHKKFI